MKKLWLYIFALVLVAVAVVAVVLATGKSKNTNIGTTGSTISTSQTSTATGKKACSLFTLANAKQLLGDTAKGGENNTNASSPDIEVSTCTYTQDAGSNAPVSGSKSATLLVREPKDGKGSTSNQNQFGPLKPASVQAVSGYGDNAYWDPQFGQLNILKNNAWYILSYGPIKPVDRTLDQTKQLADLLINKL